MPDTEKMIKICLIVIGGLLALSGAMFIPFSYGYTALVIAGILILILGITILFLAFIRDDWKKIGFVILVDGVLLVIMNIIFTWLIFWGTGGLAVTILLLVSSIFLVYLGYLVIMKYKSP